MLLKVSCHVILSFLSTPRFSEPDPTLPVSYILTLSTRLPSLLQVSHYAPSHTREHNSHHPMSLASHVLRILSPLANRERKSPARWVKILLATWSTMALS